MKGPIQHLVFEVNPAQRRRGQGQTRVAIQFTELFNYTSERYVNIEKRARLSARGLTDLRHHQHTDALQGSFTV
jgi:hypothetical protein